ncbi:MAG: NAD(P)H-binding protein [Phycisphaerae bacterium]
MDTPMQVCVTGASGFVGGYVLEALRARGFTVRALVRRAGRLTPRTGLTEVVGSLDDPASLAAAVAGCGAVVHLVGIIAQQPGATFTQVHIEGVRNLLAAATGAGVRRWVHMSALGTRAHAVAEYHRTKWAGEELVRATALDWTIFRPSLILGPGGEFAHMLKAWSLGTAPPYLFMPFFGAGFWGQSNANGLQPVYAGDVAEAFTRALVTPASIGQTYDLGGPEVVTWRQLHAAASLAFRGRHKLTLGIPAWYARLLLALGLPGLPFNADQVQMSQEPNCGNRAPLTRDFPDLHLMPLAEILRRCAGGQ